MATGSTPRQPEQAVPADGLVRAPGRAGILARLGRVARNKPVGAVSAAVIVIMVLSGIFADFIAPYDPLEAHVRDRLQGPTFTYWMGTDNLGRDVFSRVVHGARISLLIAIPAVILGVGAGSIIGIISGYLGGWFDLLVQRLLDHQRFKAAAEMLHECETVRSAQWTRPDERVDEIAGAPFERELEVDLFSLLHAFQAVLARARDRRNSVPLPADVVSIEARMQDMLGRLAQGGSCGFDDLFADVSSRQEIIVTFLATLELIRTRLIRVLQARVCGPIRIYLSERSAEAAADPQVEPVGGGGSSNADGGEEPG